MILKEGEWKTHLTIASNFMSSKYSNEMRTMHSKSDKIDISIGNETDEIIKKQFDFLL